MVSRSLCQIKNRFFFFRQCAIEHKMTVKMEFWKWNGMKNLNHNFLFFFVRCICFGYFMFFIILWMGTWKYLENLAEIIITWNNYVHCLNQNCWNLSATRSIKALFLSFVAPRTNSPIGVFVNLYASTSIL